jgi:hypothetical protein
MIFGENSDQEKVKTDPNPNPRLFTIRLHTMIAILKEKTPPCEGLADISGFGMMVTC